MTATSVRTVLGPVSAAELGVVAVHETLLSVLPGAQYGYDVDLDRAVIFRAIADRLTAFKAAGGGTVVDAGGMFAGRDVRLYEALSRATGVHIIASSGQMEEGMLGGYFLTPQTNPPTPWPAEKFAALYAAEVTEGMVVPRVERRGAAGAISTAVTAGDKGGMTATDESQVRGCARAARQTGVALMLRAGDDPVAELTVALDEGLAAERIAVANAGDKAPEIAAAGAFVVFTDVTAAVAFAQTGKADRTLVATGGAAIAFGHEAAPASYADLIAAVPAELSQQLLVANPAALLAVKEA